MPVTETAKKCPLLLPSWSEVPAHLGQGMLTLILKGEVSVQLTSSSLLVRIRLFWKWKKFPSLSWCSWFLTSKEEEVSRTDTSPFRINVTIPCLGQSYLNAKGGIVTIFMFGRGSVYSLNWGHLILLVWVVVNLFSIVQPTFFKYGPSPASFQIMFAKLFYKLN